MANSAPPWVELVTSLAEQATVDNDDLTIYATGADIAPGSGVSTDYEVPAGKILNIYQYSFASYANLDEDADNNQICQGEISINSIGGGMSLGGNGGGGRTFAKPLKYVAGTVVTVAAYNRANHNCDMLAVAQGYLTPEAS